MRGVFPITTNTERKIESNTFEILDNVILTDSKTQLPGKQSARKRKLQGTWKLNI